MRTAAFSGTPTRTDRETIDSASGNCDSSVRRTLFDAQPWKTRLSRITRIGSMIQPVWPITLVASSVPSAAGPIMQATTPPRLIG